MLLLLWSRAFAGSIKILEKALGGPMLWQRTASEGFHMALSMGPCLVRKDLNYGPYFEGGL